VAVNRARRLPTKTNFIDLPGSDFREVETGLNGESGETGIMLEARDALFRHGEKQFAVAHNACGGIVHLRVVNSDCQHEFRGICKLNIKLASTRTRTAAIQDVEFIKIATT